ncbi:unnamed protein product [Colias eurytheme]|nr:unnamed protein product [Colias eurytheme]
MRGEAAGARGKGARSGTNYPPISAAYWLPPSNPTPYHVPGLTFAYHYQRTGLSATAENCSMLRVYSSVLAYFDRVRIVSAIPKKMEYRVLIRII